jgi:hypothetical protein
MCLFPENNSPILEEMFEKIGLNPELYNLWKMDVCAVLYLNKLYEYTPFEIVVSSNWANGNSRTTIQNLFDQNNINVPLAQDYRLSQVNLSRLERIKEYIVRNNIKNYLIIDDYDSCPEMSNVKNITALGIDPSKTFAINFDNGISLDDYKNMRTQVIQWK